MTSSFFPFFPDILKDTDSTKHLNHREKQTKSVAEIKALSSQTFHILLQEAYSIQTSHCENTKNHKLHKKKQIAYSQGYKLRNLSLSFTLVVLTPEEICSVSYSTNNANKTIMPTSRPRAMRGNLNLMSVAEGRGTLAGSQAGRC